MGDLSVLALLLVVGLYFAASVKITNWIFRAIANIFDADALFYSMKFKMSDYFFNTLVLFYLIAGIFFRG